MATFLRSKTKASFDAALLHFIVLQQLTRVRKAGGPMQTSTLSGSSWQTAQRRSVIVVPSYKRCIAKCVFHIALHFFYLGLVNSCKMHRNVSKFWLLRLVYLDFKLNCLKSIENLAEVLPCYPRVILRTHPPQSSLTTSLLNIVFYDRLKSTTNT